MKYVSKIIVSALSLTMLLVGGLNTVPVSAHTLKVDKAIGVTVHINPDDEPLAGSLSQVIIGIQDKEGRFVANASECICALTIVQQDGVVAETLPFAISGETAMVSYVFQKGGIYKLEVSGTPRRLDSFQNFSTAFSYRVRANDEASSTADYKKSNPMRTYFPFVVIGSSLFLGVLYILPIQKKKGKRRPLK